MPVARFEGRVNGPVRRAVAVDGGGKERAVIGVGGMGGDWGPGTRGGGGRVLAQGILAAVAASPPSDISAPLADAFYDAFIAGLSPENGWEIEADDIREWWAGLNAPEADPGAVGGEAPEG